MKLLDRYLGRQFVGPFLVGVAAFVGILLGVGQIYEAVKLVLRENLPVGLVVQAFMLRIPMVVALTMPMATVFASLMSSGELSSHGEIVAMRAGGVSIWRLSAPAIIAGVCVSIVAFTIDEAVGPACNRRATQLTDNWLEEHANVSRPVTLTLPSEGTPRLLLHCEELNVKRLEMTNVLIVELHGDDSPDTYFAPKAVWQRDTWLLEGAVREWHTDKGYRKAFIGRTEYPIGKTPQELREGRARKPEDMTLTQLLEETARIKAHPPARGKDSQRPLRLLQHYHIRIATPWAAVCFAILGFPLGMRPQRTSTGVGFGLSLAIVFVYYIAFNVLRAFGEQGDISPLIAAWLPNLVVIGVGIGLMMESSR